MGPAGKTVRLARRAPGPTECNKPEAQAKGGLPGAPGPTAPTIRYATTNRDHDPVIFLTEERPLSAGSPLGDMVGHARSYHTRQSSHGGKLTWPEPRVKS